MKLMHGNDHSSAVTIYQRYARVGIVIGIITAIIFCTLYLLHLFPIPQLEDWLIRQWFSMRGERHAPPDIVIITIDNESLRRLGRWPWRRCVHARLLRRLRQAQVVLMDILFMEPEREHPNDDVELRTAMVEAGNVLLPILRIDEPCVPTYGERRALAKMLMFAYPFSIASYDVALHINVLRAPLDSLLDACAGAGIAYSRPDSIGIYRRIPLGVLVRYEHQQDKTMKTVIYPSVVLEAARIALGLGRADVQFTDNSVRLSNIVAVHTCGGAACSWLMDINFVGGRRAFVQYPYYLVHDGRVPPSEFRNKVVLVGFTAQGLYDIRPSPFDPLTYGVEILANAIYTLLHRQTFIYAPPGVVLTLVLALGLALGWALPRINPLFAFSLFVFALAGITFIALKLFNINIMLPTAPLYLALTSCYVTVTAWGYFTVGREHRRTRDMFALYVSKEVAERIALHPELAALGGEERHITVLFADIRDFTGTMQQLGARKLVELLTEYFTAMSDVIKRYGGLVDKFVGDEIMALFGAPIPSDDHPFAAVAAALEMQAVVGRLSREWEKRGDPPLRIGIGIATGIASVGNFGAVDRLQYTAFGDTVNLASRLQALTKELNARILISGTTASAVTQRFELRPHGAMPIRGFNEPVEVFEVVGMKPLGTGVK